MSTFAFKFSDFVRRDDLCHKGQSRIYYFKDHGVIVKVGKGWWASNDQRRELIGVSPKGDLVQPTVGPFKSARDAYEAYETALVTRHAEKGKS
jgi:hypothetical protein